MAFVCASRLMGCLRLRLDQYVASEGHSSGSGDSSWHEGIAPLQVAAAAPAAMAAAAAVGGRVSGQQLWELQQAAAAGASELRCAVHGHG